MNVILEQHSNYIILTSEKLIIEYYYGEVTKDVIIDMKINIKHDKNYNTGFNSILDFRDSVINFNYNDIIGLIDYIQNNMMLNLNRKVALLTNTPEHVVITILFTKLSKNLLIQYNTFSTLTASLNWTNNTNDYYLVKKIINGLRI